MRVVFDTVGFVRGLIDPHSRWGRILFDHAHQYDLIVSPPIVLECLAVLRRPELTRLFSSLPGRDPAAIVAILQRARSVEPTTTPPISRDPNDDAFLAAALAGAVDFIVSEDRDLLDLGSYEGIPIVTGERFLAMLATEAAKEGPEPSGQ